MARPDPSFLLLSPPYRTLQPLVMDDALPEGEDGRQGTALVWQLTMPPSTSEFDFACNRPAGMALIVVLPPADRIDRPDPVLRVTELCRPHSILPHHGNPRIVDLRSVLSRMPEDLSNEVADYLTWRGLDLDLDTRRLIRKTLELSNELKTVSGLARALYLSRRALGRRFTSRGLPVPSHWLHFGRVLRGALHLQDRQDTLFSVATGLGYPDGFALSNQMVRLTGIRPTVARARLGWEWLAEEWLLKEVRNGGFSKKRGAILLPSRERGDDVDAPAPSDPPSTRGAARRTEGKAKLNEPSAEEV